MLLPSIHVNNTVRDSRYVNLAGLAKDFIL